MKGKTILAALAAMCCVAWAAETEVVGQNVAVKPQNPTANSVRSGTRDGVDAVSIPQMISYQGRLVDTAGRPVPNGTYAVTFRMFTQDTGGTAFWSEVQNVTTRSGLFNCLLGAVNGISYLPQDGNCWLEMQVHPDPAMTPRVRLVSTAYAYMADVANRADSARPSGYAGGDLTGFYPNPTIGTGKVNSDKIQDRSIRGVDIATPCSLFSTAGNPQGALWIRASNTGNAIRIDSADNTGVIVRKAVNYGFSVLAASTAYIAGGSGTVNEGIYIYTPDSRGIRVDRAGMYGITASGYSGGGLFVADSARGIAVTARAFNNVSTDTAIRAYGKGIASGGWSTDGLDGGEGWCPVSNERTIIASGTARLEKGEAVVQFPDLFRLNVAAQRPVQVSITPKGRPAGIIYTTRVDAAGFSTSLAVVPGLDGARDVEFDWLAIGELREPVTTEAARSEWDAWQREQDQRIALEERNRQ
ncbi:MAG: hypothetical protein ABIK86_06650 [candidate division WOR-3 bacterium]